MAADRQRKPLSLCPSAIARWRGYSGECAGLGALASKPANGLQSFREAENGVPQSCVHGMADMGIPYPVLKESAVAFVEFFPPFSPVRVQGLGGFGAEWVARAEGDCLFPVGEIPFLGGLWGNSSVYRVSTHCPELLRKHTSSTFSQYHRLVYKGETLTTLARNYREPPSGNLRCLVGLSFPEPSWVLPQEGAILPLGSSVGLPKLRPYFDTFIHTE